MFTFIQNIMGRVIFINTDYIVLIDRYFPDDPIPGEQAPIYSVLMSNGEKILINQENYDLTFNKIWQEDEEHVTKVKLVCDH